MTSILEAHLMQHMERQAVITKPMLYDTETMEQPGFRKLFCCLKLPKGSDQSERKQWHWLIKLILYLMCNVLHIWNINYNMDISYTDTHFIRFFAYTFRIFRILRNFKIFVYSWKLGNLTTAMVIIHCSKYLREDVWFSSHTQECQFNCFYWTFGLNNDLVECSTQLLQNICKKYEINWPYDHCVENNHHCSHAYCEQGIMVDVINKYYICIYVHMRSMTCIL